jgi:hypothetical protein
MNRQKWCAVTAALVLVVCVPAAAQDSTPPPAHVSMVDGAVSLEREGRPDPAPLSMPLVAGDRLRTADGRVEVLFGDGATLHLDASSLVDFQSDAVIRLLEGRVRLTIPGPSREVSYRVDAPGGWVQVQEPGEYRIAVTGAGREPEVELVVLRGAADILNEDGQTTLRAGERAFARAGVAPSLPYVYNSAAWDAFDRWSNERRAGSRGISAQYLPETVRSYSSTFDRYGSWRHEPSYGYVWYPTVGDTWRPYFEGRWASFPAFGWTWIGTNAWAWPTHHYGRWGFSAGSWFWIPGRTWGPAWVSWASAPGYLSWCPLGWDNRPVLSFVRGSYYGGRHDPWRAWTVVPHHRFGVGYVRASYIGGGRIDARARGAFALRQSAPAVRGYAVPRHAAPIYAAGTRSGPRDGVTTRRPQELAGRSRSSADGAYGAVRRGGEDRASAFRSRPSAGAATPGSPAPSRAPRTPAEGVERLGSARARTSVAGPPENGGVQVYRGAVPRVPGDTQPGGSATRRLEVPGYRRAPSPPQPAPQAVVPAERAPSRQPLQRQRADPGPAANGGRIAPGRQPGPIYRAEPRPDREAAQPPAYRSYDRRPRRPPLSAAPEPSAPRQAPERIQAPAYRPYGPIERRGTPPPPPAAAPPRESPRPPAARPTRGDAPARSRPSGQGQADRGGAVRRR